MIKHGVLCIFLPGIGKVHGHVVLVPREADQGDALRSTHQLGLCRTIPPAGHLAPLRPLHDLWPDYHSTL